MLDTKQSLTVIFSDISTPLSPPVISFQSGTELSVFITTFYWHTQSQLFQSTNSIHSSSSYFFFPKTTGSYRLSSSHSPQMHNLEIPITPPFLQYFKSTFYSLLSKVPFVITPLSNHYFYVFNSKYHLHNH